MVDGTSKQPSTRSVGLGPGAQFHPRLGDLASDLAKEGRIGVVVALPSTSSASYQLRPLAGGEDWRAKRDGTTLRPVPALITHVTPLRSDTVYDPRAQQASLPVAIHHEDGGTSKSLLILTSEQVELYRKQFDQLIESRRSTRDVER